MKDNRIAVIGMSFKYPHIDSMGELVKYLEAGEFVPADGWKERGALLHVPEYDKVSGLAPMMTGIEYFDSRFFKTVQKETLEMSPEMKLALTHSVLAVYDSGYSLADIGSMNAEWCLRVLQLLRTIVSLPPEKYNCLSGY